MVITSSDVAMSSGRAYKRQTRDRSSVQGWGEVLDATTSPTATESRTITKKTTSTEVVEMYQNYDVRGRFLSSDTAQVSSAKGRYRGSDEPKAIFRPLSIRELFHLLLRQRKELFDRFIENYRTGMRVMREYRMENVPEDEEGSYEYECELTGFDTNGSVTTADGRQIDFDASLFLGRSYERTETPRKLSMDGGLVDPLVISFGTGSTELTGRTFDFDLDADGELDNIAVLGQACGFLAYDKNGDGIINDGSELFGAKSGDGFADLSVYDADGNGWIDEADPIFDKLKIWSKDSAGKDVLVGLGVRGIGAIFLGNAPTEFSLKDLANDTRGVIRSTGVFLREDGTPGTIQQVDLAKKKAG